MFSAYFLETVGRESFIAADNTFGLLAVMCLGVAIAVALEQKYAWASKVSGAIIALIIAMVLANLAIIPTSCVLYDDVVWGIIVPMGIPLLLLQCNMKKIWNDAGRMLVIFLIGGVGTIVGGFIAYYCLRGPFGDAQGLAKVTAMMTGSYIGGGVNFAAMSSQFQAGKSLSAAATVADNLLMAVYFFVLIACAGSRLFRRSFSHPHIDEVESNTSARDENITQAAAFWNRKQISLKDVAINIAYAVTIVFVSQVIADIFSGMVSADNPNAFMDFIKKFLGSQYVWITTLSMLVATYAENFVEKLNGSQEIGTYLIYLFLFVIGVPANIVTVVTEAPLLLGLTTIMVIVNMLFCFVGAKLLKFNLEDAIIASNANIGGPATAAGMAISQGWGKLAGPALLVGVLGYVLGNYAGTIVGIILGA